jgi:hypothetical protein
MKGCYYVKSTVIHPTPIQFRFAYFQLCFIRSSNDMQGWLFESTAKGF